MYVVRRNDLMLGFLNRDQLAEFRRLDVFAFPDGFRVRFKHTQYFVRGVNVASEQTGPRLVDDPLDQGASCCNRRWSRCRCPATAAGAVRRRCATRRIIVRG